METFWKLRLNIQDMDIFYQNVKCMQDKYFNAYIRSKEVNDEGENPHYHYYVEITATDSTLRQFIRDRFGKGNGVYSLKRLDGVKPIEYLAYILKMDRDPLIKNISEEVLRQAREYDEGIKEAYKTKKLSQWRQILNYIKEHKTGNNPYINYRKSYCSDEKTLINTKWIISLIIQWYRETQNLIRQSTIEAITIHYLITEEDFENTFQDNITSRIMGVNFLSR